MLDVIEHPSGLILSVKTFRPLWIFPWTSSIWRQFPLRTSVGTIMFNDKAAAEKGHHEIVALFRKLTIQPDMGNLFTAVEEYAQSNTGKGVKSVRVDRGHAIEGKVTVEIKNSN